MKIKQSITLLSRAVAGLKAKSELIVTKQQPGLASPLMKRQIDSMFDGRIPKNDPNTDVNKLDPGFYVGGKNLINVPETQMGNEWFIDISVAANGDKVMYATNIPTGSTWKKIIVHGDSSGLYYPRKWAKVTTETTLWSGSGDVAVGQTFKLVDNWTYYDGLIVTYAVNGALGSARLQVPRSDIPTGVPSILSFVGFNMSGSLSENNMSVNFVEIELAKKAGDESVLTLGSVSHILANLANGSAQNIGIASFAINNILGVR